MLKKTLKTKEQLPYEVILGVNRLIIWSNGCFNMCRSHVVSLCFAGCCRKSRQLLQRYEKTESHMLVCTDCPQLPLIRTSNSEERCARKCKVKKNFNCRWIIFCSCVYLISRTCFFFITRFPQSSCCPSGIYTFFLFYQLFISQLLPGCFSEPLTFSGTARNATCFLLTVSPTMCRSRPASTLLYTKKKVNGKAPKIIRCNSLLFFCFFLMRTFRCGEVFTRAKCEIADCSSVF